MPGDSQAIEQELLAIRCQLGEVAAFDELVDRWHGPLWQYVRRMADSHEIADELVQETWLRVLRGIGTLQEPAKLVPWMFGIAHHVLTDRLRQRYRHEAFLKNAVEDLQPSGNETDEFVQQEEISHLLDKLDGLPFSQRELLTLYYLDELSIDEVAEVLDVAPGTVKSRLFHARRNLKQSLLTKEHPG